MNPSFSKFLRPVQLLALASLMTASTYLLAADAPSAKSAPATAAPATAAPAPAAGAAPAAAANADPEVKKATASGICHDKKSPSYKQTKNFTPFNSMDECLKSGGKPLKAK
jgi:hypothetical protein